MVCKVLLLVGTFIVGSLYELGLAGINNKEREYPIFSISICMVPSSIFVAIICHVAGNSLGIISD